MSELIAKAPIVGRHYDGSPLRIGNPIHVINPVYKEMYKHSYLFMLGQIGTTFVLVYENDPCSALEEVAEWCVEHGLLGHVTPLDQVRSSEDLGCDCEDPWDCDSHTYTNAGWLGSDEWRFNTDPTAEYLRQVHRHR